MNMWRSSVGEESATAQAMVQALQKIRLTKDIVDKINQHCEWILDNRHFDILYKCSYFLQRHPRKLFAICKEASSGISVSLFVQNPDLYLVVTVILGGGPGVN